MGTSSLYKGPKSAALLPSDFTDDNEELSTIGGLESEEETSDTDSTVAQEQNEDEGQSNSNENQTSTVTSGFQSAKRNFTNSFGGSTTKVKTAIRSYVKALGGHRQATQQAKTARKVTGGICYLLSGSSETVKKKFEEAGIPVDGRPIKDVLSDICLYLAPAPNSIEDALVTDSLMDTMSELAETLDATEDFFEVINKEFQQQFLSAFVKAYIFNKIIRDCSYGVLKKCDSAKEIRDGEKQIKDIVDAIVDYVLPKCMVEGTTPKEISKAVEGMYDACYQEAERIK